MRVFPPRVQRDITTFPQSTIILESQLESLRLPGNHLYITGPVGSGKTLHAAQLTLENAKYGYVNFQFREKPMFISIPQLLMDIKASFSDGATEKEHEIVGKYSNVYWLVLDDLGVEKSTDWVFQILYMIINHRYEFQKTTIFTSNLDLVQLSEKLGDDRIPSRISQMCDVLLYNYKDAK
jgi:DNA replication protein DnaC